jgi:hypothetical protein
MSALIEAARAALEAFEPVSAYGRIGSRDVEQGELQRKLAALRAALAAAEAQPVGEPVAWSGDPSTQDYASTKPSTPAGWMARSALQQAALALEELQGPGFLIGGVMHYRIGLILPKLNEAIDALAAPPAQPAAPLTDEQIKALVLATVYEGDCSTPHRDAWAAEIGVPFARAIERAHGIGEGA